MSLNSNIHCLKCVYARLFQTIVSWIGSQANIFEKQKVREIATFIRDTDRHGKAQITNINEGEETQEMLKVSVLWNNNLWLNSAFLLLL